VRLLLDSNVWLWALQGSERLPEKVRGRIVAADAVFVSAASVWEVAIKAQLGKLNADAADLVRISQQSGFLELPVTSADALTAASLPAHHQDPFDRILVAQAVMSPLRLLTSDAVLRRYSELVEVI
jgi:PIN domain nuclease of toxin-antitoxin system